MRYRLPKVIEKTAGIGLENVNLNDMWNGAKNIGNTVYGLTPGGGMIKAIDAAGKVDIGGSGTISNIAGALDKSGKTIFGEIGKSLKEHPVGTIAGAGILGLGTMGALKGYRKLPKVIKGRRDKEIKSMNHSLAMAERQSRINKLLGKYKDNRLGDAAKAIAGYEVGSKILGSNDRR